MFQCPKGDVSIFYYSSKLNVFNFTLYEIKGHKAQCFVWHEAEGNRGANEIGSCILSYLQSIGLLKTVNPDNQLEVVFYSDNCCGQQKNRYMISTYMYAVANYNNLKSITHKFLIKGHSQNEGDSVHACTEKEVRRATRSGPIYVPDQFITLIRSAKKKGDPYIVNDRCHRNFYDLKTIGLSCR